MTEDTEDLRRARLAEINAEPGSRSEAGGPSWPGLGRPGVRLRLQGDRLPGSLCRCAPPQGWHERLAGVPAPSSGLLQLRARSRLAPLAASPTFSDPHNRGGKSTHVSHWHHHPRSYHPGGSLPAARPASAQAGHCPGSGGRSVRLDRPPARCAFPHRLRHPHGPGRLRSLGQLPRAVREHHEFIHLYYAIQGRLRYGDRVGDARKHRPRWPRRHSLVGSRP